MAPLTWVVFTLFLVFCPRKLLPKRRSYPMLALWTPWAEPVLDQRIGGPNLKNSKSVSLTGTKTLTKEMTDRWRTGALHPHYSATIFIFRCSFFPWIPLVEDVAAVCWRLTENTMTITHTHAGHTLNTHWTHTEHTLWRSASHWFFHLTALTLIPPTKTSA